MSQFLPYNDSQNTIKPHKYIYEAIKTKYQAAVNLAKSKNYNIGNQLYVVFQGETDVSNRTTKSDYKNIFKKVHNNLKSLGITNGSIVYTAQTVGKVKMSEMKNVHEAQQELIKENNDIVLASSYPYERFVSIESDYNNCNTKVTKNNNGNKENYSVAFSKAIKSVDYPDNTIHFTSASLSQIGLDAAKSMTNVSKIELIKAPTKNTYIQNYEKLNTSGGKIRINYASLKSEEIELDNSMITGFDNSKVGKQTLTITYKGKKTTYDIIIKEKKAQKIEINKMPSKTVYIQNYEKLDVSGGKLKVTYNDTSTEIINIEESMVTGFNNTKLGTNTLTITYEGIKTQYKVAIKPKELESVEILSLPDKLEYILNYEKLNVNGGKLKITYNDTSTETINIERNMVTGFNNSKVGKQTLTITYQGKKLNYDITVKKKEIQSIEVSELPLKTEYIQNYERLDVSGGKLKVIYNDTSMEIIDMEKEMVTGFDNSKIGRQTLTITYQGKSFTYDITINKKKVINIEISQLPSKIEYIQNYEKLDVRGGMIKVTYNDASIETIDMKENMVYGFDNTKLGINTVSVLYRDLKVQYEIVIKPRSLINVEFYELPSKLEYIFNYEELNVKDGKLKLIYNDTSTELIDVKEEMVTGFNNSIIGKQTLKVQYGGVINSYVIEIVDKKVETVQIASVPNKLKYIQNYEDLKVEGGKLKIIYNDTSIEKINIEKEMIKGFDNSKLGKQILDIEYAGIINHYEIEIVKRQIKEIKILSFPRKIEYIQNYEDLDVSGGTLKVIYNDEEESIIEMEKNMILGFDNTSLGEKVLKVKYGEFENSYKIKIVPKKVVEIKVIQLPKKLEYIQNRESLDTSGGKITIKYNDTTTEVKDITEDMIVGFDNSTAGIIALLVNYEGFNDSYNIRITKEEVLKNEGKYDNKIPEIEKSEEQQQLKNDVNNKIMILPYAGKASLSIILISIIIFSVIVYIKYRKYRDIE